MPTSPAKGKLPPQPVGKPQNKNAEKTWQERVSVHAVSRSHEQKQTCRIAPTLFGTWSCRPPLVDAPSRLSRAFHERHADKRQACTPNASPPPSPNTSARTA